MTTLDDVYRKFGMASEAAQLLETELGNQLLSARAAEAGLFTDPDPDAAVELLRRVNRQTLGALLRQVHDSETALQEGVDLLAQAVTERNRLVHSFYREHNLRRNSSAGCLVMLQDLESIHQILIDAYTLVLRASGVDLDTLVMEPLPDVHLRLE